jgi:hypothetical protein
MPVENQPAATPSEAPSQAAAPPPPTSHDDAFSQALAASQSTPATSDNAAAEPAPAAAPANSSPQAASAAPAQVNFRELAGKAGLRADQFQTDQELFEAMLTERSQLLPLVNVGRQFAPHLTEFQKFLQQQQAAAPAEAAVDPNEFDLDKHFDKEWGAPAWDKQWDFFIDKEMLVKDEETGLLVPKPGYEAMVAPHVQKINDALELQSKQHLNLFRGNPYKAIHQALSPVLKREMEQFFTERFGAQQTQAQQQTELQSFEKQYGSQLFDQAGQPTAIGAKLGQIAGRMMDNGMPEHEALTLAAEAMGLSAQAAAPAAAQPAIAPTPAQASGAKVESFIDQARRNASHQPNSAPHAGPTTNPAQPYVSGEVELANMWSQAAAQAAN